jgi:hypothetical protein
VLFEGSTWDSEAVKATISLISCNKELHLIFLPSPSSPIFHGCISNRKKSHDNGSNDAPSEEEFLFSIQTSPAVKALVYLVRTIGAEDLTRKAVQVEKPYTLDVF